MTDSSWWSKVMRYKYTSEYIAVVVTILLMLELLQAVKR